MASFDRGLFGYGSALNAAGDNPELYAQFQADRNRQMIANMMLARGMQQPQGQMAGRFYVPPSPLQQAGSLLSTGLGAYSLLKGDQDRIASMQGVKDKRQQALAEAIQGMSQDLSPTKQVEMEAQGPGAPIATERGQMMADMINESATPALMPGAQEFASNASPYFEEGQRPTAMQEVPKSQQEIMAARMKYLGHPMSEVRDMAKYLDQQQFMSEEKQLDREARHQDKLLGMEKDLALAVAMGANKDAIARMEADLKQARHEETVRHNKMMETISSKRAEKGDAPQKAPPGYRFTGSGDLEAIPGGPADQKMQAAFTQDTSALQNAVANMDRLASTANQLLSHPGLAGITGLRGAIPDIPGTDAANARAKLEELKSQVGFQVLQDMRNNSKTGGALGNVSDAEGKRLESNLAALNSAQSLDEFKGELQKILKFADSAKGRFHDAYNMKYGEKKQGLKIGDIDDGYRYKGGDPGSASSWEKVK